MLGLTLREEFRGRRLKGTAIELSNDSNTGATQIAAQAFLEITYPTHYILKGIEAVGPTRAVRSSSLANAASATIHTRSSRRLKAASY